MTDKIFNVFDLVKREGLDNTQWGLLKDVGTASYFGTKANVELPGKWLLIRLDD